MAAFGVAAAGVGEMADAPGLVLLGALLIAGGGAVAYRRGQAFAEQNPPGRVVIRLDGRSAGATRRPMAALDIVLRTAPG